MRRAERAFVTGLVGALALASAPFDAMAQPPRPGAPPQCSGRPQAKLDALEMMPDPTEASGVSAWTLTLTSTRSAECLSLLVLLDGSQPAGRGVRGPIKPGQNKYTLQTHPGFKLERPQHCFRVQLDGTTGDVDAAKRFCATQKGPFWSLK